MIRPLGGRVLVKLERVEEKTKSGIIVMSRKEKEKPSVGIVMVGGEEVKKGDRVLFNKFSPWELEDDLALVDEDEILGIIE